MATLEARLKKLERKKQIDDENMIDEINIYTVDKDGTQELIKTIYPYGSKKRREHEYTQLSEKEVSPIH